MNVRLETLKLIKETGGRTFDIDLGNNFLIGHQNHRQQRKKKVELH